MEYNGWKNYSTWRVFTEVFACWEGELTPEMAEEHVLEVIKESSYEGVARDYAEAFIDEVDWTAIALAVCPSWAESWREEFSTAFCEAAPSGFIPELDADSQYPWQAPWIWEDYQEWALDEDACKAGALFAKKVFGEMEALIKEEAKA